jgi:hypothetical protein
MVDVDVVVELDRRLRPVTVNEPIARSAASSGRSSSSNSWRRDLPYRFITRPLRSATSTAMYSLISSSEKHVMLRSLARIQRCAISTPPSTFALSRGLIGRAGKIVVA